MSNFLTWNKGFFDSNYQLFSNGKICGSMLFDSWKNDAKGMGLNSSYFFKTENFFNPITQIINDKNEIIGTITYGSWQTKASIKMIDGEVFGWSFTSSWLNSWMITDFKEKKISYHAKSAHGTIDYATTDEVVLLTGIFIREFYARILIICLLLFIVPAITRIGS